MMKSIKFAAAYRLTVTPDRSRDADDVSDHIAFFTNPGVTALQARIDHAQDEFQRQDSGTPAAGTMVGLSPNRLGYSNHIRLDIGVVTPTPVNHADEDAPVLHRLITRLFPGINASQLSQKLAVSVTDPAKRRVSTTASDPIDHQRIALGNPFHVQLNSTETHMPLLYMPDR